MTSAPLAAAQATPPAAVAAPAPARAPQLQRLRSEVLDAPVATHVPTLGPIMLKGSGAFDGLVHTGPLIRTEVQATYGGLVSASGPGRLLSARA